MNETDGRRTEPTDEHEHEHEHEHDADAGGDPDADDEGYPEVPDHLRREEQLTTVNGEPVAPMRCPDCQLDLIKRRGRSRGLDGDLLCKPCWSRRIYHKRMAEFRAAHGLDGPDDEADGEEVNAGV